jgi:two-component system response regulator HydG
VNEQILIVDDDQDLGVMLSSALQQAGYTTTHKASLSEAVADMKHVPPDCVISDICLGHRTGLELCEQAVSAWPDIPIILITAYPDTDRVVQALRLGVCDFLTKPVSLPALEQSIERALRRRRVGRKMSALASSRSPLADHGITGNSPGMRHVYELVERVRETNASVLITGESGTGKELVAKAIHAGGESKHGPFVAINCAAVPATLLESELFGHVKGAFTDAKNSKNGLLVEADAGSLFLDEISEMPLEMQAKLLRVLQERKVRPVGATSEVSFNTRLLTATNRNLEQEVKDGRFRQDLYYRINVVHIQLPPLRERGDDILELAHHFLKQFATASGKSIRGISTAAALRLVDYDWLGNVRELENCMERAVTLARTDEIQVEDLPDRIRKFRCPEMTIPEFDELLPLEQIEHRYIQRVLRAADGNKTQAARILGMDRRTLYRRLNRLEAAQPAECYH